MPGTRFLEKALLAIVDLNVEQVPRTLTHVRIGKCVVSVASPVSEATTRQPSTVVNNLNALEWVMMRYVCPWKEWVVPYYREVRPSTCLSRL